ncbi:MAG TPA: 50S ribosomal protein L35 [Candidatus Saccharimonadales bacterium]
MPKLKVHSGFKKRVKITGSGKLIRRRAWRNHNLSKKRGSRRRLYAKDYKFDPSDIQNVKRQLGI